jgi:hypothetical protein
VSRVEQQFNRVSELEGRVKLNMTYMRRLKSVQCVLPGGGRSVRWWLLLLLLLTQQAFALEFEPTDFEWSTWPAYCRARYMVSGAGMKSRYSGKITPEMVTEWQHKLQPVWYGLHHYCAGIHLFTRALHEKERRFARNGFEHAAGETSYTLARSSESHPMFSTMLTLRGRAYFELGRYDDAKDDFGRAIQLHPDVPDPYAAWGLLLRQAGHLPEARDVLERGVKGTKGGTAELHYLLGIVLTDMKDYEPALEHAKLAYKMGYPLPGLKRKLQNAGHWSD